MLRKNNSVDIPISDFKVIHCLLPPGKAQGLLLKLKKEKGIVNAFAHHMRGGGLNSRRGRESFSFTEGEIVTLMAPAAEANEIFEFVYYAAGIGKPRSGMILMEKAQMGVPLDIPTDIPDDDQ